MERHTGLKGENDYYFRLVAIVNTGDCDVL